MALSSLLCVAAASTRVAAEEAPEAIHLRFEVEESLARQCPGPERFMQLLRAEHPSLTLAPEGGRARTFDFHIRRDRDALAGEVVVTAIDGRSYSRTVTARDCPTLTRALAVVAAVASNLVPFERRGPDGDGVPPGAPAKDEPQAAPSEDAPAAGTPSRSASKALRRSRHAREPDESSAWSGGVGLGTELVLGSLPRPVMGYRGYVDVQRAFGVSAVGMRLSLAHARAPLPGTSRLNVLVHMWTARLEGCASRRAYVTISVEGCVGATSGSFEAFSTGPTGSRQVHPWLSLGAGARVRWHIGKAFYAELFGNVSSALTTFETVSRDSAAVRDSVSPVVGELGLGLGHSFGRP